MATTVTLSARDLSLLRLLSWTPASTALILRASSTFEGGSFADERRLRERLQALCRVGFVRFWSTAHAGGGLQNYYKLTPAGFDRLYGPDATKPPRAFFVEISPTFFEHTMQLAEAIIETMFACHAGHVTIERFYRENELMFAAGNAEVQPDCFFRFNVGGRSFNVAVEIDMSQESLDSVAPNSLREKIRVYDTYQDTLLSQWQAAGRVWERPRFRVVFLTRSVQRAYHILSLARLITANPRRRLVYAATQDSLRGDTNPVRSPVFLDHAGHWQALVDLHPTAAYLRAPVQLGNVVDQSVAIW